MASARRDDGPLPVYEAGCRVIATVNSAKSRWLGTLLAECERVHIYVLPSDPVLWHTADAGCPRCRVLDGGPS